MQIPHGLLYILLGFEINLLPPDLWFDWTFLFFAHDRRTEPFHIQTQVVCGDLNLQTFFFRLNTQIIDFFIKQNGMALFVVNSNALRVVEDFVFGRWVWVCKAAVGNGVCENGAMPVPKLTVTNYGFEELY